jgi:MFS family permease
MVGSAIVCSAINIPMLIVGRFINGFSVGICSAQVPVYITEIAPPNRRGRLVSLQQWAITWGIMIMYFICYGCSFVKGNASFRIPWGLQMIPAAALFPGLWYQPESPRWLFRKGRETEAKDVLVLLHGNGNPDSPFVFAELQQIRDSVEEERKHADASWSELFASRMINRTLIGVSTQIWSQLTGMNVMVGHKLHQSFTGLFTPVSSLWLALADSIQMYYITYVFSMAGLSRPGMSTFHAVPQPWWPGDGKLTLTKAQMTS